MKTSRSSQEWRDSWRELRPHLSWMQRHSDEIIAAEHPDQIEAFISKHTHHRFTDDELQGLRDGTIREAIRGWSEATRAAYRANRELRRAEREAAKALT